MNYYTIPGAFIVTIILSLIVSLSFNRPLRGLWIFVLIVFLATWSTQLWIQPIGPVYWGVSWAPVISAAIFFWLLILALTPPYTRSKTETTPEAAESSVAIGFIFWIMLVVLLISIGVGYYRLK
jgi:hypothetical protein